jgi:hypothetical protein
MKPVALFCTVTPTAFTSAGRRDCACDTRFWTSMAARSGSRVTSKVTVICEAPSFVLVEVM